MEAPAEPPEPWGMHINMQGCFYCFPEIREKREDNVNLVLEFLLAGRMVDGGNDIHFPGKCSQCSVWFSNTAWRGQGSNAKGFMLSSID